MSVSPEVLAAFIAWRNAELAEVRNSPCSDKHMSSLVDATSAATEALAAVPATNADDLVLKILPLAVGFLGRRARQSPFALEVDSDDETDDAIIWRGLVRDLPNVSAEVRAAMAMPL